MKKFFLAAIAVFALPLSATAGQVLPNLYAREFCDARRLGMSRNDAIRVATRASYVASLPNSTQVTFGGKRTDADLVSAVMAAVRRCPQYFS